MAFTADELQMIDASVGAYCREVVPAHAADRVKVTYVVDGQSVVICESWLDAPTDGVWRDNPIAKFRYYRSRGEWLVYWRRATGEWDRYDGPRKRLSTLVRIVDEDRHGCFFG